MSGSFKGRAGPAGTSPSNLAHGGVPPAARVLGVRFKGAPRSTAARKRARNDLAALYRKGTLAATLSRPRRPPGLSARRGGRPGRQAARWSAAVGEREFRPGGPGRVALTGAGLRPAARAPAAWS